jgi:hypothetical protein
VPIPENPAAVTLAIEKGLVRDPVFRDWLLQESEVPDVLSALIALEFAPHSE